MHAQQAFKVLYVQTASELEACRHILERCIICALDAEWSPAAAQPSATLLQLAVMDQCGTGHVLLLDMFALWQERQAVAGMLQGLFRDATKLKVGYRLHGDLLAITSALGSSGAAATAVVQPALELATLHQQLWAVRAPGLHRVNGRGLAALVEAELGCQLDKALQCSAWAARPLSQAQLDYAALDAACLLMLLSQLVTAAPPAAHPINPSPAPEDKPSCGHTPAAASRGQTRQQSIQQGSQQAQAAVQKPLGLGDTARAQLCRAVLVPECVSEVARHWAGRMEMQGGRLIAPPGTKPASGKRLSKRQRTLQRHEREAQESSSSYFGWPSYIPWQHADGAGTPRFICDVMAEGLARQLRLCGVDAAAVPNAKAPRHVIFRSLVDAAETEGRVVLTCDRAFIRAAYTEQAYFVRTNNKREQLQEVLGAFGITVDEDDLLSRCAGCNGEFIPEPLASADLPADSGVPLTVRDAHSEFWVCARCGKVFWQGGSYSRAMQNFTERLRQLRI